ncbi:MAG: hypothetical protein ACRDT0_01980, partial [Pseudonocardiaceae bacterium]
PALSLRWRFHDAEDTASFTSVSSYVRTQLVSLKLNHSAPAAKTWMRPSNSIAAIGHRMINQPDPVGHPAEATFEE